MRDIRYERPLPRWATFLGAGFVALLLVALITVPIVINSLTEKHRNEVRNYVESGERLTGDIHFALAHSVSGIQGYQATGRHAFAELYKDQIVRIEQLLTRLKPVSEHLGPELVERSNELRLVIERWRYAADENGLLTKVLSGEEFRQRMFAQDHLLETAYQVLADYNLDLYRIREVHRESNDALAHLNIILTVFLTFLSLGAIVVVWRITSRLRSNAQDLGNRVREEEVLREFSTNVIAAVKVPEVLQQIVRGAIDLVEADGGFIEKVDVDRDRILVAATDGIGPPIGETGTYKNSVAEALVNDGDYQIINSTEAEDRWGIGEFRSACASCAVLGVPLIADQQPVGVLFLLRRTRMFVSDDIERVRLLVVMAALSLRKTLLLDASEKRRSEAERAVRSRDEMLRVVSHDLRNPLGNIAIAGAMLENRDIGEEKRQHLLKMVHRLTDRMNRIIQDLVDIARAESGQPMPLDLQEISARPLLDEACALNRMNAERKRIRFDCAPYSDDIVIRADRHRILQVLSNLIDNALKFSPERGAVSLKVERTKTGVQFSITDTGPGIPESEMEQIFAPFWRDARRPEAGIGLGLAIVKKIVELHGGGIGVRNEPAAGTTFYFWLPAVEQPRRLSA